MKLLGIERIRKNKELLYHPQSNSLNSLKNTLTARLTANKDWVDELQTVKLRLRAAYSSDTGISAAEIVIMAKL